MITSFLRNCAPELLYSLKLVILDEPDKGMLSWSVLSQYQYPNTYRLLPDLLPTLIAYVARLKDLKTFTARVCLSKEGDTGAYAWLYDVLWNLSSSVEEVRIEIEARGATHPPDIAIWQWDHINWASLNESLDYTRLPNLRRVSINVQVQLDYQKILEAWVEARVSEMPLFKHVFFQVTVQERHLEYGRTLFRPRVREGRSFGGLIKSHWTGS